MRIFNLQNIFYTSVIMLCISLFSLITEIDAAVNDQVNFQTVIITARQWDEIQEQIQEDYDESTGIDSTESCSPATIDSTELHNEGLDGESTESLRDCRINNTALSIDY